jgi:hypothetical protein
MEFAKDAANASGPPNASSSIFAIPKRNPMGAFGGCLNTWIRLTNRHQLLCPPFFVANIDSLVLLRQDLIPRRFLHVGAERINMIGKSGKPNGASKDFQMNSPAVFVMQFMKLFLQLH